MLSQDYNEYLLKLLPVQMKNLCKFGDNLYTGSLWVCSGSVVERLTRDRGLEPHWCHCVVSLSKNINPSLLLVQPRRTRNFITERLLMGRKESNRANTGSLDIQTQM